MSMVLAIHWAGRMHDLPFLLATPRYEDDAGATRWDLGGTPVAYVAPPTTSGAPATDLLMFALDASVRIDAFEPGHLVGLLPPPGEGSVSEKLLLTLLDGAIEELRRGPGALPTARTAALAQLIADAPVACRSRQAHARLTSMFDPDAASGTASSWWRAGGTRPLGRSIDLALRLTAKRV